MCMFNVINGSWLQRQLAEPKNGKCMWASFLRKCIYVCASKNQFLKNCKRWVQSRERDGKKVSRRWQKVVFVIAGTQRTQQSGGKLAGARVKRGNLSLVPPKQLFSPQSATDFLQSASLCRSTAPKTISEAREISRSDNRKCAQRKKIICSKIVQIADHFRGVVKYRRSRRWDVEKINWVSGRAAVLFSSNRSAANWVLMNERNSRLIVSCVPAPSFCFVGRVLLEISCFLSDFALELRARLKCTRRCVANENMCVRSHTQSTHKFYGPRLAPPSD